MYKETDTSQNQRDQTTTTKRPERKAQSPAGSPCELVPWVAGSQQRSASHSESRGSEISWHICFLAQLKPLSQVAFYWLTQVSGTNVLQRKCKDYQVWDIRAVNEQQHICFPGNWPQGGNQGWDFDADFLSCSASLPTCSALRGPPRWTHASSIPVKLKTSPEKKPQRERKSTTQGGKTRRSRWEGVFYKHLPLYFSTF